MTAADHLSGQQFHEGTYNVPTERLNVLTHHDEKKSIKNPGMFPDARKRGAIKDPVEVSIDEKGRPYLEDGSHRVNAAHFLGIPSITTEVYRK